MTNIQAKHADGAVAKQNNAAEIMSADPAPSLSDPPDVKDMTTQLERGFDLLFLLREMDVLADELAKLAPSMDRTALELRLAQTRQVVVFRYGRRADLSAVE